MALCAQQPAVLPSGFTLAGSTLITLPVLVFFVLVQRRLAGGLAAGAIR